MFGLTTLEARLIGYALLLAAALGGYMYWHHSVFKEGAQSTEFVYIKRDAAAAKAASDRIRVLETQARETEAKHAFDLAATTADMRKRNSDEIVKRDTVIAGLRDGTAKLYVTLAGAPASCGVKAGSTTGTATGSDGAGTTGILGQADSAFLVAEASRANQVVNKLTAAQKIIRDQIKACNQ